MGIACQLFCSLFDADRNAQWAKVEKRKRCRAGRRWVELTVGEGSGERVDAVEDDGACNGTKVSISDVLEESACVYDGNEPAM